MNVNFEPVNTLVQDVKCTLIEFGHTKKLVNYCNRSERIN